MAAFSHSEIQTHFTAFGRSKPKNKPLIRASIMSETGGRFSFSPGRGRGEGERFTIIPAVVPVGSEFLSTNCFGKPNVKLVNLLGCRFSVQCKHSSMFGSSSKAAGKPETIFLDIVWSGLENIYSSVKSLEAEKIAGMGITLERARDLYHCSFGSEAGDTLVCNYFLWYASACYNFVQVFSKAFSPAEDFESDFKSIITWRHKVSAHTSWVWPKGDSRATQQMSISLFPEFNGGHFEVGGFVVSSLSDGRSRTDWCWCLVKEHERLRMSVAKYL